MPRQNWSDKRDRQYEHIKDGLRERVLVSSGYALGSGTSRM
jgi:hypothetical protein